MCERVCGRMCVRLIVFVVVAILGLTLLQVCVRLKQKGDVITLTVLRRGAEA